MVEEASGPNLLVRLTPTEMGVNLDTGNEIISWITPSGEISGGDITFSRSGGTGTGPEYQTGFAHGTHSARANPANETLQADRDNILLNGGNFTVFWVGSARSGSQTIWQVDGASGEYMRVRRSFGTARRHLDVYDGTNTLTGSSDGVDDDGPGMYDWVFDGTSIKCHYSDTNTELSDTSVGSYSPVSDFTGGTTLRFGIGSNTYTEWLEIWDDALTAETSPTLLERRTAISDALGGVLP